MSSRAMNSPSEVKKQPAKRKISSTTSPLKRKRPRNTIKNSPFEVKKQPVKRKISSTTSPLKRKRPTPVSPQALHHFVETPAKAIRKKQGELLQGLIALGRMSTCVNDIKDGEAFAIGMASVARIAPPHTAETVGDTIFYEGASGAAPAPTVDSADAAPAPKVDTVDASPVPTTVDSVDAAPAHTTVDTATATPTPTVEAVRTPMYKVSRWVTFVFWCLLLVGGTERYNSDNDYSLDEDLTCKTNHFLEDVTCRRECPSDNFLDEYKSFMFFTDTGKCKRYTNCDHLGKVLILEGSRTYDNYCGVDKECTCVNGVAAKGTKCPKDGDAKCIKCDASHWLDADHKCRKRTDCDALGKRTVKAPATADSQCGDMKQCKCPDGIGAKGTACPKHGDHKCSSCTTAKFSVQGGACRPYVHTRWSLGFFNTNFHIG